MHGQLHLGARLTSRPDVIELALSGNIQLLDRAEMEAQTLHGALCNLSNADLFYAEDHESIRKAKSICIGCPVRELCLKQGANDSHGIYGGLTPEERLREKSAQSIETHTLIELKAEKRFIESQSVSSVAHKYRVQPRTVQRWRKILKNSTK